jgi:hypothetical protein
LVYVSHRLRREHLYHLFFNSFPNRAAGTTHDTAHPLKITRLVYASELDCFTVEHDARSKIVVHMDLGWSQYPLLATKL